MAATGDLRSLLGPATFNQIPSHAAGVLQELWTKTTDTLRTKEEKVRVDGEQKVAELQALNEQLNGKLATYTAETERGETALQHYREQAVTSSAAASRLTEELAAAAGERDEFRRQLFAARAERDDMAGLAERRSQEVERSAGEVKALTEQVAHAHNAKCEALVRVEEVESRERGLEGKERRVEEERTLVQGQIDLLQAELEKRCEEVLAARRDAGRRLAELTQDLAERTEEAAAAGRREEVVREEARQQRSRAEQLAEKLREARESEGKLEENYRAEVAAQTKLATLYQQHSKDGATKTEELTGAVRELQGLLTEAQEKYSKQEAEAEEVKMKHQEELDKKEETVVVLRKELESGNKLIKTMREKGLSEDSIECLSPSAAQASKLLKSGITVTGIYSQMVALGEELTAEKAETARLGLYIEQILHEIEERAPLLRQQREDYERAAAAVGGLTESLESAREEVELRRGEAEEARRRLAGVERDRDRQAQQAADLGRQVATLVREVEASRAGARPRRSLDTSQPLDSSSVDGVIEARLLTFKDVSELQERNIELVAVVRELSARQEAQESSLVEEKTAELRQELDTALRQVEELRAARERQQVMVENIIQQRDMYKSMASGPAALASPAAAAAAKTGDAAKEAKLAKELEEVKKDFAEYKVEKATNFKMLNDQMEKMRDEAMEARTKAAKLGSQEEYNTERFKIAAATNESLKRQLGLVEERNRQLDRISGQHEASVTALREELLESHQRQSKAEVEADRLRLENSHLTSVQSRLAAEKDAMVKERGVASRIEANMAQIQLNLERRDEESKLRLESTCEQQQKELELMRKKVELEQEQFRDSVRAWERTNSELREKAEGAETREKGALEQMAGQAETIGTLREELRDLQDQLQLAESRLAGRGLGKQGSVVEGAPGEGGKSRLRDVELLMAQTKQELKARTNELADARKRTEEYKDMSEAAEKRMVESSKTLGEFKDQLEAKLKKAEEEREAAEKQSAGSLAEATALRERVAVLEGEAGASGGELRERLLTCLGELEEAKGSLESAVAVGREARAQAERMETEAREAQEKYEREMLLHAKDIEALNKLKSEARESKVDLGEIEVEKRKADGRLREQAEQHAAEVARLRAEAESLAAQVAAVTGENAALHQQVETATQQMADLSATGMNTSGLDTSRVSGEEEAAGSSQLMAVIKYLRQEKDILATRLEVAAAEGARAASQLEHQQRLTEDAEAALARHQERESGAVLSATKHGELIRKVETLSAVTDSNRMLREAKEKLEKTVEGHAATAASAQAALAPMEAKLKDMEDRVGNLVVEKAVLQKESDEWKKRADQLVEKSFKINPEELKKLQEDKLKLTKMVQSLTAAKKGLDAKLTSQVQDLERVKQLAAAREEENKKIQAELKERTKEQQTLQQQNVSAKNIQANLQNNNNALKKRLEDMEKAKTEMTAAMQAAANNHRTAMEAMKKDSEGATTEELTKVRKELETANQTITAKAAEVESFNTKITERDALIEKEKATVLQLKKIGRKFREQKESEEKKVKALEEEKKKMEEELAKKPTEGASGAVSPTQGDDETHKLLEESMERISTLETESERLKAENTELKDTMAVKEERAKSVLKNARNKIQKCEDEKKELELELERISAGSAGGASEEQDLRLKAIMSQLKSTKEDKEKLEGELNMSQLEQQRLEEQVESLQAEVAAAQLASHSGGERSKPVAVAGVVHQQEREKAAPRKQQQPQAHIQPHLRAAPTPRDEHRPTQTASIRPMAQRATSQAVVLPTSQMSPSQPEVATVQPTVSVSPSVSSATGAGAGPSQLPSTSQPPLVVVDPANAEFYPRPAEVEVEDAAMPRAVVIPRQDQPQASTSGPQALAGPSTGPSTSGGGGGASPSAPTTASVPPTLKRPRDAAADSDSQSSTEGAAGQATMPGGQKKARTISSTEGLSLQVSSGGGEEEGISGSLEVESDSSMQVEGGAGVGRAVGSSSQILSTEVVGTSGEVAACSGVTTSTQEEEEVLDSEQEDVEDDVEVSEDMEDGEVADDLVPEVLEEDEGSEAEQGEEVELEIDDVVVGTSEDEGEVAVQEEAATVEDNSSEPSSSTGARHGRPAAQAFAGAAMGYEVEAGEDGVVPSTPKLPLARRTDGFAEAVSSPQVPVSEHFVFAQSGSSGSASSGADLIVTSSNSGLAGQEGVDRTAVDIQLFASGAGRSPAALEQPEEGGEEQEELQGGEDSEEGGVSSVVSSTEQQAGRGRSINRRAPIVWDSSGGGTTSTSPQRTQASIAAAALRGVGGRGGPTARRSRGGPPRRGQ